MSQIRRIYSGDIVNLITESYQRTGRVRYRIRLHLAGGETIIFADYFRFDEYWRAWRNLHEAYLQHTDLMVRQD